MPPPQRVNVTREVVELHLGQEMTCLGLKRPPEPRRGQVYFDKDTGKQWFYTGGDGWQVIAVVAPDHDQCSGAWRCDYCGTHFGEQRCPTCGAGRTEGA